MDNGFGTGSVADREWVNILDVPRPTEEVINTFISKHNGLTSDQLIVAAQVHPRIFTLIITNPLVDLAIDEGVFLAYLSKQMPLKYGTVLTLMGKQGKLINISSDEQLYNLSEQYLTAGKNALLYPVGKVHDPMKMIRYGFFPTSLFGTKLLEDYIAGMNMDLIRFWHRHYEQPPDVAIANLNDKEPVWLYNTLETYKQDGVQRAESLPLLLFDPSLVYKTSKRPVTDMAIFRGPTSLVKKTEGKAINSLGAEIDLSEWQLVRVTRYAAGMARGLYNEPTEMDICGTFYYLEPESTTQLAYKTLRSFRNKTAAVLALDTTGTYKKDVEEHAQGTFFRAYYQDKLPQDLKMTPQEFVRYSPPRRLEMQHYLGAIAKLPKEPYYIGTQFTSHDEKLYAAEDYLDQPLCNLARAQGIDIIILTDMVGSHQVVTEVLDTRTRRDSFGSLIFS